MNDHIPKSILLTYETKTCYEFTDCLFELDED